MLVFVLDLALISYVDNSDIVVPTE